MEHRHESQTLKPPRDLERKPFPKPFRKPAGKSAAGRPAASRQEEAAPPSRWSPLSVDERPARAPSQSRSSAPRSDAAGQLPEKRSKDDWKLKSPRRKFRDERAGRGRRGHEAAFDDGLHLIYGMHSVREALKNPLRVLKRLLATENGALRLAEDGPLPIEPIIVKAEDIGRRLTADAVHQGVLLEAEPLSPIKLGEIAKDSLVLALDQVTDPHNVGAILRSCAAFGVGALIITERHSPEVTGVLAKAASGALEHVPFAVVRNLADALEQLKTRGFLCVGFDSEAPAPLATAELRRPLLLVMGAEGKGLRQKTRETCDLLVRLEMPGAIRSLNVSNAAAIALYAATSAISPASGERPR